MNINNKKSETNLRSIKKRFIFVLTKRNNNLKLNIMKTLKNLDTVTKIGLTFVVTILLPLVTILINEILIKGTPLHY